MKRSGTVAHSILGFALVTALAVANSGCSGGGITVPPPQLSVSVAAASPMVLAGGNDMVTATITNGAPGDTVTWSVTCPAAPCGSVAPPITPSGVAATYTAPALPPGGTLGVTIIAHDTSQPQTAGQAMVSIPGIIVTAMAGAAMVTPGTATTMPGTTTVTGNVTGDTANAGVAWTVTCLAPPCGSVSPAMTASGVAATYTGPTNPPAGNEMVTVTASSLTINAASSSAIITIPGITVSVMPLGVVPVKSGAMQAFTPTVNQDPSGGGVNWSVLAGTRRCFRGQCGATTLSACAACGSVSPASTANTVPTTYTAPAHFTPPGGSCGRFCVVQFVALFVQANSVTTAAAHNLQAINILPISVMVAPPSATFTTFSGMQQFTATVTNDGTMQGVNWTLRQNNGACSPACGTLSAASSASGTPITYTGPAMATVSPTVTLIASSMEDPLKIAVATITVPVISVSLVAPNPVTVAVGAAPQITATVMNDVTNAGVAWTLTQNGAACSPGCGMVTAATASGAPATYTAPVGVPALPAVTLTATSVADGTKSASTVFTVTTASGAACGAGSGSESLLKGQYAFLLQGLDAGGIQALAGSFTADGTGKITAGEKDGWRSVGGIILDVSITAAGSSYAVGPDHRGCLTLADASGLTTYYRFALGAANASNIAAKGHLIEFDDTTGAGTRVAGTLRLQDPTSFQASQFKGSYAMGVVGQPTPQRFASAGTFTSDGVSGIPTGDFDTNIGGTLFPNDPLSGAGSFTCCSANGRGTLTLPTNGLGNFAFYMINSGDAFLAGTNSGPVGGEAIGIPTGTVFNAASLNGVAVIRQTAEPAGGPRVDISTATADGVSSLTLAEFENNAGVFATNTPPAFTYAVAANGRVTFTSANSPVLYLYGKNAGFLVGTTADVDFGIIEAQAAGPFNPASLTGAYTLGTENPSAANVTLETGVVTADGVSSAPGTSDQSSSTGLAQNQALAVAYTVLANGTGTFGANTAAILISGNKLVFISNTSATPTIIVVEK